MVQEKYRVRLTAQEKGESPDWVICPPKTGPREMRVCGMI